MGNAIEVTILNEKFMGESVSISRTFMINNDSIQTFIISQTFDTYDGHQCIVCAKNSFTMWIKSRIISMFYPRVLYVRMLTFWKSHQTF